MGTLAKPISFIFCIRVVFKKAEVSGTHISHFDLEIHLEAYFDKKRQ